MVRDNKGLILSLSIGLIIGLFYLLGALNGLELKLGYDYSLLLNKKSDVINKKIKIIGIDSQSIDRIGVFPWRRDLYTKLLKKLENKPKIISFDILLSDYSAYLEDDIGFSEEIKKIRNVILPISLETDPNNKEKLSFFYPIEEISKNTKSLGLINYLPDSDGILRKTKIFQLDDDNKKINIFPYEIARQYLNQEIELPENIYCNFQGKEDIFEIYSFYDVLAGKIDPDIFKDSIVLVGAMAEGLQDRVASPIGPMYGVIYHAQLLSNILNNNYINAVSPKINFILIFSISFLSYLIWRYFDTSNQIILIFSSSAILYIIHIFLFKNSIWISGISIILTNMASFVSLILLEQIKIAKTLKFELDSLIRNYYKKNLKYRVYQTNVNLLSDELDKDKLSNTERVYEISKIGKNLALERSFLETLLNNIKIPIIVTNHMGNVILTNPNAESFFFSIYSNKEKEKESNYNKENNEKLASKKDTIELNENIFENNEKNYLKEKRKENLEFKINTTNKKEILIGKKIFDLFVNLPTFQDELKKYYENKDRNSIEFEDDNGTNIYKMRLFNLLADSVQSNTICLMEDVTSWHKMANKDGLTSLWNQRFFKDQLKKEIERAKRYKTFLSLIMMDVDHFKKFNDTYGHQTGDIVLKNVARVINETVRNTDIPARYGGEEFAIILTVTDEVGALILANRLRQRIEELVMKDINNKPVSRVTASFGVCFYTDGDLEKFIESADIALYECKENGRNTVVSYSKIKDNIKDTKK